MASARVVHVFSRVSGITGLIQKRRPDINLISIAVDEHGIIFDSLDYFPI